MSSLNCLRHVAALVIAFVLLLESAHAAPARWLKIQADGFIVYTNASENAAVDCAVRYAAFRRAFREFFLPPDRNLPPSILMVFRTADDFKSCIKEKSGDPLHPKREGYHTVNYSYQVDGVSCNAFSVADDRDRALEMTFEFETIWALPSVGYYAPLWMSQGAGEILSKLSVRKNRIVVGRLDHDRAGENIPWETFFTINTSSKLYNSDQLNDYLEQAWSLMHWILLDNDSTRERFAGLTADLRTTPAIPALERLSGSPVKEFARSIRTHFHRFNGSREIPFDEAAVRASLVITPAPEAEVLVHTADLLVANDRVYEGNVKLDAARELAPDLLDVKEAQARRLRREGRTDDAAELYREAIAVGSKNSFAYLFSAQIRLNNVASRGIAGEGGPQAEIAADELRHAIAINPASGENYELLGRAFFVSPNVTNENIVELSRGLEPTEAGARIRYYRGLLYRRLERIDDAIADFRLIAEDASLGDNFRSEGRRQLSVTLLLRDQMRVTELAKKGDFDGARRVVAAAEGAIDDNHKGDYERLGESIDELELWRTVQDAYAAEKWIEAHRAAEAFLIRHPNSKLAYDARLIVENTESAMQSAKRPASDKLSQ